MTQDDWIRAITDAAAAWRDPNYPERDAAVKATLKAPNRFTEEGLAFALNHRMHQVKPKALRSWIGERSAREARTVGVICAENVPLDGLSEVLAAVLLGHHVVVSLSPDSPALLPAFLATVSDMAGIETEEVVRFVTERALFEEAGLVVASGDEETIEQLAAEAEAAGIPASRRWLRRRGLVAAVIDGTEDAEARSGLAEDLLLHEGVGPRSPAIIWAPAGREPDRLLDTLAGFRELYPPHPATEGTLSMPIAFLISAKQAHAAGPGFLLSKGEPEPQGPGHIRWSEYAALADVSDWLRSHRDALDFVVATAEVGERLGTDLPVVAPGDAHRPPLGGEQPGLVAFLSEG